MEGASHNLHKWVRSDLNRNYINECVHNTLMHKLDDEQLERSDYQFQETEEAIK